MSLDRLQDLVAIVVVIAVAAWYVRSALRARHHAAGADCRSACGGCAAGSPGCPESDHGAESHTPRS
jgi:hypothetical protein